MDKKLLALEKDIKGVKEFAEGVIVNIGQIKEQTQSQYAKLYWTGIKLANNRSVLKIDEEIMTRLCKEVEILSCYQDIILDKAGYIHKYAEWILDELKKESEKDRKQLMKLCGQIKRINKEIDSLHILYKSYHEEQIAFIKAINNVGEFFTERLPQKNVTIQDKLKKIIMNRRKLG